MQFCCSSNSQGITDDIINGENIPYLVAEQYVSKLLFKIFLLREWAIHFFSLITSSFYL